MANEKRELALLSVDDPSFFKGARPLSFGDLPRQRDKVAVYGFPAGGDELSITEGYHDLRSMLVHKVNGMRIGKMADLVEAVKKPEGGYHVIEGDPVSDDSSTIVIDAAMAEKAMRGILERQGIPSDRSANLGR